MLKEIEKCQLCGESFKFNTSECGQIILRMENSGSSITFLPKCPHCQCINKLELSWDEYERIDY